MKADRHLKGIQRVQGTFSFDGTTALTALNGEKEPLSTGDWRRG